MEIRIYRKEGGFRDILVKRQALGKQKTDLICDVDNESVKGAIRDMMAELGQPVEEEQLTLPE